MFNTETDYLDEKSILNQMVKYDNLVQKFYDIVRRYQSAVSQITSFIDNVDDSIRAEFAIIENEMNTKLKEQIRVMELRIGKDNPDKIFNFTK